LLFSVSLLPRLSKNVYLSQEKYLTLKSYSRKCGQRSHFFQQISTSKPNFIMKFSKFSIKISIMKSITNNLSKTVFCIKIVQQMAEISSKEGWKTSVSRQNRIKNPLENHDFFQVSHVFQPSFDNISAIWWPILMQNTILERLLVIDYMIEIWIWNFKNFMQKLGSKVKICWKKRDLWPHFLE
jgi:hypothetical protein